MRKLWQVKCKWCDRFIVGDWRENSEGKLFRARHHTKEIRPGFRYTHNQMKCIGAGRTYHAGYPDLVPPNA